MSSILDSNLGSSIPAISRSHIRASRQSASLDAVDLGRGIKLMSPSVRMGMSAFWIASAILKLHWQFPNASAIKYILKLGGEYSTKSLD